MPKEAGLEIVKDGSVTVVGLGPGCGQIDDPLMQQLRIPLVNAGEAADPPLLLLDVRYTDFFGTAFIEVVLRVWNELAERNGQLGFCHMDPYCREVLEVTQLTRLWDFYETREQAVAAMNGT